MAERIKAADLKSAEGESPPGVRIPFSLQVDLRCCPLSMTLNGMPEGPGQAREDWIFEQVITGQSEFGFSDVVSTVGSHTAIFKIFSDALKIDGVRVCVDANNQQRIADILGCSLLTPKLADLAWSQRAVKLQPFPRGNTNGMSSNQACIDHSTKIDQALSKLGNPTGLVGTVGKHWVIDNDLSRKPGMAMNYGWHFDGPNFQGIGGEVTASLMKGPGSQYVRMIQGRGTRHDGRHSDYSQNCVLVSRSCIVDGVETTLESVLVNPELATLASHQGIMKVLRQPGVPDIRGTIVLPEIKITPDSGQV